MKQYDNKEWLYEQYWILKKSIRDIAKECNCSTTPIIKRLKDFKIKIRSSKEGLNTERSKKLRSEINKGSKNPMFNKFKEDVSYNGIHWWVRKNKLKPEVCEICHKSGKLELSNKTHTISRNLEDWQWIHHKCHYQYDLEHNLLKRNNKGQFSEVDNQKW